MPNYCDFAMEVQGNFRNVDTFVQIMNNNYDKIHMYRIFEATPTDYENYGFQRRVCISGYCAWSVMSCMLCENVMADRAFTIPKLRLPNGEEDWDAETPLVRQYVPKMDYVYSSEPGYGEYFSRAYPEATHVIVDAKRQHYPISSTMIRAMKLLEEKAKWMV